MPGMARLIDKTCLVPDRRARSLPRREIPHVIGQLPRVLSFFQPIEGGRSFPVVCSRCPIKELRWSPPIAQFLLQVIAARCVVGTLENAITDGKERNLTNCNQSQQLPVTWTINSQQTTGSGSTENDEKVRLQPRRSCHTQTVRVGGLSHHPLPHPKNQHFSADAYGGGLAFRYEVPERRIKSGERGLVEGQPEDQRELSTKICGSFSSLDRHAPCPTSESTMRIEDQKHKMQRSILLKFRVKNQENL